MLERERILRALAALSKNAPPLPPATSAADAATSTSSALPPLEAILDGEWVDTEHGRAFVKDVYYPLDHLHGTVALGAPLATPQGVLQVTLGHDNPPPVQRLGFFDTETTGLAGGTGTYIFLAGLGTFEGERFRLRQYFLPGLEHERAMLAVVLKDLSSLDAIVSYNGRAFDMPLLSTRRTLARLRSSSGNALEELGHFDLLRASRRLYRGRLESCALVQVESHLLGFQRENDVPGHLIPSLYFDYIRAGRAAPLRAVLQHNALDILSLTGLLAAISSLFERASINASQLDPQDALALAHWHELDGKLNLAEALYRSALPRLDAVTQGRHWTPAAARFARLLKQGGLRDEAMPWWQRLLQQGNLEAGIEIAKHLEHQVRDLDAAIDLACQLRKRWPDSDGIGRSRLEHRLARLERKRSAAVATPERH